MIASQRDDGDYDVLTAISQDTLGADRAASIAKHAWGGAGDLEGWSDYYRVGRDVPDVISLRCRDVVDVSRQVILGMWK